jgi:hypothetical protein
MASARVAKLGWCRFYQPTFAVAINRQAWKSASVFSTYARKTKSLAC